MGKIDYYFNGKRLSYKKDLPKGAKHIRTEIVHDEFYGDAAYIAQQAKNASEFSET